MSRQGRILVIDDLKRWRDEVTEILQRAGYHVDAAALNAEALEMLKKSIYHVLIVDIRMNEADPTNEEGIDLLRELLKQGLSEATKVIMLSAYGTKERVRTAFKAYEVADFLDKFEFDEQTLLESVGAVFATEVNINLALDIRWQPGSRLEQAVEHLEVQGSSIVPGTSTHGYASTQLGDLLCRLFHSARSIFVRTLKPGHSGAGILWVQPFYQQGGAGQAVAVKFGDFHTVEKERDNFKQYIQPFISNERIATIQAVRRTPWLGGIIYSLLDTKHDQLVDFGDFYHRADVDQIKRALNRLFQETCWNWYASHGDVQLLDLTEDYQRSLSYQANTLERVLSEELPSVRGEDKLFFQSLIEQKNRSRPFTNPILVLARQALALPTYRCITHGDFNQHNLLVDNNDHIWLIDFQATGPSHILRDVAALDAVVRFQLLTSNEATLDERLQMEEVLCSAELFSQVGQLANAYTTQNPALAKVYDIVVYLRKLAGDLVAMSRSDDMSEYYIALLYTALNTIRFTSLEVTQREHALLSASLLADRLKLSSEEPGASPLSS